MTAAPVTGPDGKTWFLYGARFDYEGQTFIFQFHALNHAHAEQMLGALKSNAELIGELVSSEDMG